MSRNGKAVVAMSGGVDSSVAAALLREQGYDCVGVLMRNGIEASGPNCNTRTCCGASDAEDARRVADKLGIPFYVLDFEKEFGAIIDYFVGEYNRGRTPNPCVMCNQHLKFGKLFRYAEAVDAEFVATGHYAQVERLADGEVALRRGADRSKDQSYALFGVRRRLLGRMLLPIGDRCKPDIRAIARTLGLLTADKPDSQEICFVPSNNYVDLLKARSPQTLRPGDVLDTQGNRVGGHEGFQTVTIGQRKGLRIALGKPVYVVRTDPAANTITVGDREELLSRGCSVSRVNWLVDPPSGPREISAQIRYNHDGTPARLVPGSNEESVELEFEPATPAVTPGQAAVFYDGDRVLGGGWIDAREV